MKKAKNVFILFHVYFKITIGIKEREWRRMQVKYYFRLNA